MTAHADKARERLGELAGLAAKTEAAERRILQRAEERLAEVQAEIEKLRPGIEGAADADQQRYLDLVSERGQIHTVIAKARKSLGQ